jgi:hypothetical protein
MLKKQEPLRPVHAPWFELVEGDDFNHTVGHFDRYTGPSGGGDGGPSSSVMQVARGGDLASMFLQVLSTDTIQYIAKRTDVYAKREWVVPVSRRDRDGNITARPFYSAVYPNNNNLNLPSNARHRWIPPKGNRDFDITDNFVLAWLGIVIYSGALFSGDNNRGINAIYSDAAYGISVPFIQNTMTRNAFKFMLRYIHFSDGSKQKQQGEPGYNPLFKVAYIVKKIAVAMRATWLPGERITVDESMVRYNGRAIAFVQYMPRKPIKHGIKVFAVCCAYSGVMLGFEVYCGADENTDSSALAIIDRLLTKNNLDTARGRIVYSDNWYTTVPLARYLYEKYGMFFCGDKFLLNNLPIYSNR